MNDPGYVNYSDSRLQPPDEGDEQMGAAECWVRCVHGDACQAAVRRLSGNPYSGLETAEALRCDECDEWEEM